VKAHFRKERARRCAFAKWEESRGRYIQVSVLHVPVAARGRERD
jgi:hypothetical protein